MENTGNPKAKPKPSPNLLPGIKRIAVGIDAIKDKGIDVQNAEKRGATEDQPLWVAIRQCVNGRGFNAYDKFIRLILCKQHSEGVIDNEEEGEDDQWLINNDKWKEKIDELYYQKDPCHYKHGIHGYELLKSATEIFLLCRSCCAPLTIGFVVGNEEKRRLGYEPNYEELKGKLESYLKITNNSLILPYIGLILENLGISPDKTDTFPFCLDDNRVDPCLYELIWSYWHEEGMLSQTLGAIALRFQNQRVGPPGSNPLANFELNSLRPISNLLWGYINDTRSRLTVKRRAYEYEHEYGLKLVGKAVGNLQPADRRSKFLHAYHNLLHECSSFYKDDSNHWITPDTFPMLQAIKEVHLLLAEGAHNQWGDLPSTARVEMMIEQWLLAQPPMREFLHSRAMVPYQEMWMGQVDAMKGLMNWTDVSVMYFHQLAVFGEMILLSLRYGNWSDLNLSSENARNWALYWKPEIQGYIESYRAATGVDLSATATVSRNIDAIMPSAHLKRRLAQQQQRKGTVQAR